jgi:hypothetical protein
LAECLTLSAPEFELARQRAATVARGARLRGRVQLLRGSTQALSGSRFDIGSGADALDRQARRSSQLRDGFLGVIADRPEGGRDLYVLVGVETKLASQVGELPAQLAKTRERLEGMGLRVGTDVFVLAELGSRANPPVPGRRVSSNDGQIVAAPRDARTGSAFSDTCDRAVAQPARSRSFACPFEARRCVSTHGACSMTWRKTPRKLDRRTREACRAARLEARVGPPISRPADLYADQSFWTR